MSKGLLTFIKIIGEYPPLMFIIMAVDTEVFPVGTIRRVVVVIAVFVVNGEEVSVFIVKFTGALGADQTVNTE